MEINTFAFGLLFFFVLFLFVAILVSAAGITYWAVKRLTDQLQTVNATLAKLLEVNQRSVALFSNQETLPYIQELTTLVEGLNGACLAIVRAVQELRDSQEKFKQKLFNEGSDENALLVPADMEAINSLIGNYRSQSEYDAAGEQN